MKEYIEREAAVEEIRFVRSLVKTESEWLHGYASGLVVAADSIMYAPAADVAEVVQCKNCKYYAEYHGKWECNNLFWNNEFFPETKETDFCSYGEWRKNDEP